MRKTTVLAFALNEASAKLRSDLPIDGEEDTQLPIWSGLIPLQSKRGMPVADESSVDIELPGHLKGTE